ncbi:MAG: UvrD-helicase domain-containing protein [Candidatus Sericytochromatia bacterium]|nr:UvrD-helicase domain-containing protein [Candidatus Sericytochromatia bacterium]
MKLNEQQKEAIYHVNGPLLILAGAGSGKTRVLTERIANLISNVGVRPYNILAVTFTNKSAKEMKERVSKSIGEELTKMLWIGTFHSICSKILRTDIQFIGRNSNFVIYDNSDQNKIITECLKKLNIDDKSFPVNKIIQAISKAKSSTITAEEYTKKFLTYTDQRIGEIYVMYEDALKKNNALDFDDMLFYVVQILKNNPERLEYYQNKFKYILVDEYQDTNLVQYELIRLLGDKFRNICVVGDVDQSIYSFRNADFRIILNFKKDYSETKMITLDKNYRSTKKIISLSNEIIEQNKDRFPKNLTTDNAEGEKIGIYDLNEEMMEVLFVIKQMENLRANKGYSFNDFTVLYRTNAQSRIFEEYFIRNNIPHQVLGGFRFFDRKEIKDILSYLKVIFNPEDAINLQRIINTPKRSIGNTTVEKLLDTSNAYNMSLWDILNFQNFDGIGPAAQKSIRQFVELMKKLIQESHLISVSKLIQLIVDETRYIDELQKEDEKSDKEGSRVENVNQLINSAFSFEIDSDDVSLEAYLSYVSLISDIDALDGESNKVKLMTVHTSKGLEFPVVFIVGLAEGIFPHSRSENHAEIEEERRLMYVAITRAKELLHITFARERMMYGSKQHLTPSRFFSEIKSESLVECYKNLDPRGHRAVNQRISLTKVSLDSYSDEMKNKISGFNKPNTSHSYASPYSTKRNDDSFSNVDMDYSSSSFNSKSNNEYNLKKSPKKLDNLAIQASLESRYANKNYDGPKVEFKEGEKVQTAKWGKGTISKIMKNNEKFLLIINFDSVGGSKIIDPKITIVEKY